MISPDSSDHLNAFCDFLASTRLDDVPRVTSVRAIDLIIDSIGVMLAGSCVPEVDSLKEKLPDGAGATVMASEFRQSPDIVQVATINAIQMGFVELDEVVIPPGVHPAIHILPSILAMGQTLQSSGEQLIEAFLMGYEATVRIHRASRFKKNVYPHGHTGTIGAAVALGKLRGWKASDICRAINIAAAFPVATSYKSCLSGASVSASLASPSIPLAFQVVNMTEAGFEGDSDALADTFGYLLGTDFSYMSLMENADTSLSVEEALIKYLPVCGRLYPMIEAISKVLPEIEVGGIQKVKRICVTVDSGSAHLVKPATDLPMSGKFSIPFVAAVMLVTGSVPPPVFSRELMRNHSIREVESKIEVRVLPPSMNGPNFFAAIDLDKSSQNLSARFEGNIEDVTANRSSRNVDQKFRELTEDILGISGATRLHHKLRGLGDIVDVNELLR